MQVRFSDESTLYDFSVAGITVLSYTPAVGKRGELSVTDTLEILISTNDADSQQSTKDEINNWLALAVEQWETVSESRIFIEIKQADETDWRRSEMLGGRLRPNKNTLDSHSLHKQEYLLTIDRRNWWEWPEEEIELSYDNDHFATGGLPFQNDGSANFFGNIAGDPQTPIPVRLEFVPTDTSQYIDRLFISHNVFSTIDPNLDEHLLNASDALPDNTGVDMGDATNYNELDSTGGETVYLEWTLTPDRLAGLGGRWFRLLGRVKAPSSITAAVFGKFSLYSTFHVSELPMAVTEETLIASDTVLDYDLIDFGAMRLPTLAPGTPASLKLRFSARSSAAFTLWLDIIQLSPVDSFHHIETTYTSALNPEAIIADGRIGRTYIYVTEDVTPGYTLDAFADVSPHISVWPGRSQWFTVLHRNIENLMQTGQELTVRAYYRPRRTTI